MARRSIAGTTALALLALLGSFLMAEVLLGLLDYRFSPFPFLAKNDPRWREDWMTARGGPPPSASAVFDPDLLWRPAAAGDPGVLRKAGDEYVIVALGDGDTFGPLDAPGGWPRALERLLDLNETARPARVINAAGPGYSALQGLRRFRELAVTGPDLACFAFGANDGHGVRMSDAEYVQRAATLRRFRASRLAAPAFHLAWGLALGGRAVAARVDLDEFERALTEFVALARERGVEPLLLTRPARDDAGALGEYNERTRSVAAERGAALIDVASELSGSPELFADALHLGRAGRQRLAESLFARLADGGLALSRHGRAAELDLAVAGDDSPELEAGWGARGVSADGLAGRWTGRAAALGLERRADEGGLVVEFSCRSPKGVTSGRFEIAGETFYELTCPDGRHWRRLNIDAFPERRLALRFLVDEPPRGILVHSVRLVRPGRPLERTASRGLYAATLDLETAGDDRPELGAGWWSRERWTDGREGRWTAREASLFLERRGDESGLIVDVTLQSPANLTSCRIEANGRGVYAFRNHNGRYRYGIDLRRLAGRLVRVRFVVDRTFVPIELQGGRDDPRALGIFVHSARLASSPIP